MSCPRHPNVFSKNVAEASPLLGADECRSTKRTEGMPTMGILKKMKMTMLALSLGSLGSIIGCSDYGGTAVDGNSTPGEVGIALVLPGGASIQSVTYSITGPMG